MLSLHKYMFSSLSELLSFMAVYMIPTRNHQFIFKTTCTILHSCQK